MSLLLVKKNDQRNLFFFVLLFFIFFPEIKIERKEAIFWIIFTFSNGGEIRDTRNPQLLTQHKQICCTTSWSRKVKNTRHQPKTCNETMLRDKVRVLAASSTDVWSDDSFYQGWHLGEGGNPIWNRRGCSSEILNLTPKGDHLGVAQAFCDP